MHEVISYRKVIFQIGIFQWQCSTLIVAVVHKVEAMSTTYKYWQPSTPGSVQTPGI